MRTTVSTKGQIILPAEFRQMDNVKPGQEFEVERLDRGDDGAVDWLLTCPEKDFVAIESESTDVL